MALKPIVCPRCGKNDMNTSLIDQDGMTDYKETHTYQCSCNNCNLDYNVEENLTIKSLTLKMGLITKRLDPYDDNILCPKCNQPIPDDYEYDDWGDGISDKPFERIVYYCENCEKEIVAETKYTMDSWKILDPYNGKVLASSTDSKKIPKKKSA